MNTHKVYDNKVYTLREFIKFSMAEDQNAYIVFHSHYELWCKEDEYQWIKKHVRDLTFIRHFNYMRFEYDVRVLGYLPDVRYTEYLLKFK